MGCKLSSDVTKTIYVEDTSVREDKRVSEQQPAPREFHSRYTLVRQLGQGTCGTAYSVSDALGEFLDDELVVKVLKFRSEADVRSGESLNHRKSGGSSRRGERVTRSRVKHEIEILRRVSNVTYCVLLVDAFMEDDFGYIVMERCDLTFLSMLRSRRDLDEFSFVPIAHDMFAGLAAIHGLRIIHRDIKPDNYMFSRRDSSVKLCDFDLSVCFTVGQPLAIGVRGTAPFMSPEMLKSSHGTQTDIWSVGVLVYLILLGEFPYMPSTMSGQSMKQMIQDGFPTPSFRPALARGSLQSTNPSDSSVNILRKLLDRDPSTRATARDALNHAWFEVSATSGHTRHSLQPLITSAVSLGGFGPAQKDSRDHPLRGIDPLLVKLQDASSAGRISLSEHPKKPHFCKHASLVSTASWSTHSTSGRDCSAPNLSESNITL